MQYIYYLFATFSYFILITYEKSILDFGGIENDNSVNASKINSLALQQTFQAAINDQIDRVVEIPSGKTFFSHPISIQNFSNLTIKIDGQLFAHDDISQWPNTTSGFLDLQQCSNIHITGNGIVDGQGYNWWFESIFHSLHESQRPHLVYMEKCQNVKIDKLQFRNSMHFNLNLKDIADFHIFDINIYVDVFKQKALYKQAGLIQFPNILPLFPLNTDGIDPSGKNVLIENVTIENYDDAVAVKPASGSYQLSNCSENITVINSKVKFGVGMTIGSVPPNSNINCVRNVKFININFTYPIKAIYVKTNPGSNGYGIIENIVYENIQIYKPLWWAIYIGPQQQAQPDGGGTGIDCMLYPLRPCQTQPRVNVSKITLKNIQIQEGLLPPGVIRCNSTNICKDFVWDNVQVNGWFSSFKGYIVENVQGIVTNSKPEPKFFKSDKNQLNIVQNEFKAQEYQD